MKTVKLKKIAVNHLTEIFQSLDIKFSFVNKNMEQVTVPAKCRDFLGDCIYSKKKKAPISIYGFSYNYNTHPYDDCRFSLTFPNKDSMTNFINNISWLHEKEKQAGLVPSEISFTDDKATLIIEGSRNWISAIWKVSLYTFYLKVISYPSVSHLESPENKYITKLTPEKEAAMLSKVKSRKAEHYPNDDHYSVHNSQGFYSMLTNGKSSNPVNTKFVLGALA